MVRGRVEVGYTVSRYDYLLSSKTRRSEIPPQDNLVLTSLDDGRSEPRVRGTHRIKVCREINSGSRLSNYPVVL